MDLRTVSRERVSADIAVQFLARAGNLVLGVAATILLTRYLGERAFGQWATVFAVIEILGFLSDLGFEQVAVRKAASDPGRASSWMGALISLRLAIALPVIMACLAVLIPISTSTEMRITALIVSATMFTGALGAARGAFQLQVRNDVAMLVLTLNSCLWTGAVIAVVHAGGGMVPLAFAFVATAFVTSGLQFAFATRQNTLRMRGSVGFWRELARTGIPLGIAGLLTLAYVRIDGVLVYELAGASQAGQYSAVYRVLDRAQLIPESMATTLLPIFAACYGHNLRRLRRLFDAAVTHLSALTLPALAFTVVAAGPIVTALFGPTYAPAAAALPILMGTFVLISMGLLLESMIIAIGQAGRLARYALAALVVNVCLNLLIVPSYGFVGAAWVTVATQLVLVLLSFRCVLAKLGVLPPIGPTLRAGLASAVMGGCVYFLHKIGWPLALLALAAPALYLPLVFGLGVVKPTDAVALVRGLPLGRLKPHQQSQLSAPEEAG